MENVQERLARLEVSQNISEARLKTLARATELGVTDSLFLRIANAAAVGRSGGSLVLPPGRYDHCSRGKGWARHGRGDTVQWGESVTGGYRVNVTGRWTVGSSDGFNRKDQQTYTVSCLAINGDETWLIAE